MKKPSPLTIIATGLVMLCCAIVLMGDFFFSYLPDPQTDIRNERQRVADTIAITVVDMLSQGELNRLSGLLDKVAAQDNDILSTAIRKNDSTFLVATENHIKLWSAAQGSGNLTSLATVPIDTKRGPWGTIEFVFKAPDPGIFAFITRQPSLGLLISIVAFGFVSFGLYMKRILRQFDPNTAIPDRIRAAFDAMTEGVVIIDAHGRIAMANDKFRNMGNENQTDPIAQNLSTIKWLEQRLSDDRQSHPWHRCIREQQSIVGEELTPKQMTGDEERIIVNCAPIVDSSNNVRGCMVTFDNITELHHANQRLEKALEELRVSRNQVQKKAADLQRLASTDYLTGVLNRRAFTEQASKALKLGRRRQAFSCIMIDIDRFKSINDTFGHSVGDLVIQSLANILNANTRDHDLVSRFGGEEFCIALPDTDGDTAMVIAERIRVAVEEQLVSSIEQLGNRVVTTSVGVAVYEQRHKSLSDLVGSSDDALYEAKETGRNKVCMSDSSAVHF